MMSVPLVLMIASKFATICPPTGSVAVILAIPYELMGELVQVN